MEYLKVRFPTRRKVKIDGEFNGYTNKVIRIQGGPHTITMGKPLNFRPKSRRVNLKRTSVLKPKIVKLEKVET